MRIRLHLPGWVDDLDRQVDEAWEVLRDRKPVDTLFYAASAAGDFSLVWHAVNAIGLATGRIDRRQAVRIALALGADSLLVNQGIKRLFERDRPIRESVGDRPWVRNPSTSSFPSGHASSAVVAARLLGPATAMPKLLGVMAATVATSRIHVRVHHASDVAVGAAVGFVFSRLVAR